MYGLGEFPISFWWAPPTAFHNYDDGLTRQVYQDMADSGINLLVYNGELDYSAAENTRIMNIAGELGMKFIGNVHTDVIFADKREVKLPPFFARLAHAGQEIYLKKLNLSLDVGEQVRLVDADGFFALGEVKEFEDGAAIKPIRQF